MKCAEKGFSSNRKIAGLHLEAVELEIVRSVRKQRFRGPVLC